MLFGDGPQIAYSRRMKPPAESILMRASIAFTMLAVSATLSCKTSEDTPSGDSVESSDEASQGGDDSAEVAPAKDAGSPALAADSDASKKDEVSPAAKKAAQEMHERLCAKPAPKRFPPEFKSLLRRAKKPRIGTKNVQIWRGKRSVTMQRPKDWDRKYEGLAAKLRSSGWTVWVSKDTRLEDPMFQIAASKDGLLASVEEHRYPYYPDVREISVTISAPPYDAAKYLATVDDEELLGVHVFLPSMSFSVRGDKMASLKAKLEAVGARFRSATDTGMLFYGDDAQLLWMSINLRDDRTDIDVRRDCPRPRRD